MSRRTDMIAHLQDQDERTPRQAELLAELERVEAASARTDELTRQAHERD
jgi:hypothetical protein